MIENLQIFRRRNNVLETPSLEWNLRDKIYVSGEINLGLNDRAIFDQDNAPTLRKVIKLIQLIKRSSTISIQLDAKRRKIEIVKPRYDEIEIYSIRGNQRILILKKTGYLRLGLDNMLNDIYKQLEGLNKELRKYYCTYLNPINTTHKFDFELGELVKTTDAESINNYREGIIYALEYHLKEKVNFYYIRIKGKIHNRRYCKEELTINEYDR